MSQTEVPNAGGSGFNTANPHALAAILEASETRSIIASSDIFDIRGIKLWARNQPVSQDLQRKLMDRSLSKPLETCLAAEDGVSPDTLVLAIQGLIDGGGPLTPLLKAHAPMLLKGAKAVRLHSVVQLLLTATQAAHAASFGHAVEAMATAGALMHARGGDERLVAQAMTAGLLHDIGEMYIAPEYREADASSVLDVDVYRQLVVHPHVGQLLITQLTDYSKDIVRAIAEHHERMDGSGFPHCLQGDQISPLGRLLAATEEALAALRTPGATLHHASVALRVVPGEYDERLSGPLTAAARSAPPLSPKRPLAQLRQDLSQLDLALQEAMHRLEVQMGEIDNEHLQKAGELARFLLGRLRGGWNESGLWGPGALGEDDYAEAEAVVDALQARLRSIERAARLAAGHLSLDESHQLDHMLVGLVLVA
jgi:HD domain